MRPVVRGVMAGVVVFAATTIATIAATTLMIGGETADRLVPLRPGWVTEPPVSSPIDTTRSDLRSPVEGGNVNAILVEPEGGAEVIVAGAGASGRGDLLALAERFAADGIAALTYDRRADGCTLFHRDFPGLGHDVPADVGAWLPSVAAWMKEPRGAGLVGAEPSSDLGAR